MTPFSTSDVFFSVLVFENSSYRPIPFKITRSTTAYSYCPRVHVNVRPLLIRSVDRAVGSCRCRPAVCTMALKSFGHRPVVFKSRRNTHDECSAVGSAVTLVTIFIRALCRKSILKPRGENRGKRAFFPQGGMRSRRPGATRNPHKKLRPALPLPPQTRLVFGSVITTDGNSRFRGASLRTTATLRAHRLRLIIIGRPVKAEIPSSCMSIVSVVIDRAPAPCVPNAYALF